MFGGFSNRFGLLPDSVLVVSVTVSAVDFLSIFYYNYSYKLLLSCLLVFLESHSQCGLRGLE